MEAEKGEREREKTFINDSIHTSLHNNQKFMKSYLEAGMTQILKAS